METEEQKEVQPRIPSAAWVAVERPIVEAQCERASDRAIRVAKQCGRPVRR